MEEIVTLVSNDGQEYSASQAAVEKCQTVKDSIEDVGVDTPIPLPNVTGDILKKVLTYAKYDLEHPEVENDKKEISEWENQFLEMDQTTLFSMILAANYLNYPRLLDLCCKSVANMIKGKTVEEIRKVFNVQNDFTEEEEKQVEAESEWLED